MATEISSGQLVLETCFDSIFCSIDCYVDGHFGAFDEVVDIDLFKTGRFLFDEFLLAMLKLSLTCKSLRRLSLPYIFSVLKVVVPRHEGDRRWLRFIQRRLEMVAEGTVPGGPRLPFLRWASNHIPPTASS
jgi:hypothetical protein